MFSERSSLIVTCLVLLQQTVFASFEAEPTRIIPGSTDKLTMTCVSPEEITDPLIAIMVRKADGVEVEKRSQPQEVNIDMNSGEVYESDVTEAPDSYRNKFYRRRRSLPSFQYASMTGSGLVTVPDDKSRFQISGQLAQPGSIQLTMTRPTSGEAGQYACQMTYMTISGQVEVKSQSLFISTVEIENAEESKSLQSSAAYETRLEQLEKQAKMFVSLGQGMQAAGKLQDEKMNMLAEDVKALKAENKELVSSLSAVNAEVKTLNDKFKALTNQHETLVAKVNSTDSDESGDTSGNATGTAPAPQAAQANPKLGPFNPFNPASSVPPAQYNKFGPGFNPNFQQYGPRPFYPQQFGGGFAGYSGYGGVRGAAYGGYPPNQGAMGQPGRGPGPSVEEDLFAVNTRMGEMDNTRIQTLQKQVKQLQDLVVDLQQRMIKVEIKVNYTLEDEIKEVESETENGGPKNLNERLVRIENLVLPVMLANLTRLQIRVAQLQNITGVETLMLEHSLEATSNFTNLFGSFPTSYSNSSGSKNETSSSSTAMLSSSLVSASLSSSVEVSAASSMSSMESSISISSSIEPTSTVSTPEPTQTTETPEITTELPSTTTLPTEPSVPTTTQNTEKESVSDHSCYVCGNVSAQQTCTRRDRDVIEDCGADQQACITEVSQDGFFRKLYRRCATLEECVQSTSETDDECYKSNFMTAQQMHCTFCCTSKNCNIDIRPEKDLYKGE